MPAPGSSVPCPGLDLRGCPLRRPAAGPAGRRSSGSARVQLPGRVVAGGGPQDLPARWGADVEADGGHELRAVLPVLDERGVRQLEQLGGVAGEPGVGRERGPDEGRAPRGLESVTHHVADHHRGGPGRARDHEVEVAGDQPVRGGERGRELQVRAHRDVGRGQRLPERLQFGERVRLDAHPGRERAFPPHEEGEQQRGAEEDQRPVERRQATACRWPVRGTARRTRRRGTAASRRPPSASPPVSPNQKTLSMIGISAYTEMARLGWLANRIAVKTAANSRTRTITRPSRAGQHRENSPVWCGAAGPGAVLPTRHVAKANSRTPARGASGGRAPARRPGDGVAQFPVVTCDPVVAPTVTAATDDLSPPHTS